MKFVLLAEGQTEKQSVGKFLKRWIDGQFTSNRVGMKVVSFDGGGKFVKEYVKKAHSYLSGPEEAETIGVIGLLDFYQCPTPANLVWFEKQVGNPKFRMFFAVHESEAWLLSQPEIFPRPIRDALPKKKVAKPERVNTKMPPSKLLNQLYLSHCNHAYRKDTDGQRLFGNLNPETARAKCPGLCEMLDVMLAMAKAAGL